MSTARPIYNYYDNEHPSQVLPRLRQWVSRRVNHKDCACFYIGQTTNPEARFLKHQKKMSDSGVTPWDEMHVIYGNQSLGFVTEVENGLIRLAQSHEKWTDGGFNYAGARYDETAEYFVYVLVDHDSDPGYVNTTPDRHFMHVETNKATPRAQRDRSVLEAFKAALKDEATGRTAGAFYVGFTNSPDRRFREHQDEDRTVHADGFWDQMLVIYRTPSLDNALETESALITHGMRHYGQKCRNSAAGRLHEGRLPYSYVYYLEERENQPG